MKKILYIALLVVANFAFAQIRSNNPLSATINSQSAFLDASALAFSNTSNTNNGKGMVFPRTNLTNFTFVTPNTTFGSFPTVYDGMIVYNTASGTTPATGSGIGGQTVAPGFYYFSNPTAGMASTGGNGSMNSNLGRWLPLGGAPSASPVVNITTTEAITNTQIAGAQVYVIKGTFTADGFTTKVNIPSPTGMTGLYTITIFKAGSGSVYARDLYSYTVGTTAGNAVTGSPNISSVYPAGTYDYVLEYLK